MPQSTITSTRATGTYGIKAWDEKTWDGKDRKEQPGTKLTYAKITFTFQGDLEGEANVQLLMHYRDDSYATIVGLQQMNVRIGEKSGSFVCEANGIFEHGAAKSTWRIIPGSGNGDLEGIRGEGTTTAVHGDQQPYTIDYYFA